MSAVPLYQLEADLEQLEGFLDCEELDDDQKKALIDDWLGCMEKIGEKLDGYAALIRSLEARARVLKNEEDHFKARRQQAESTAAMLKSSLLAFMQGRGWEKYPTKRFEIRVCSAGGSPPVLVTVEPEKLPTIYQRITVEPDKAAILTDLQAGMNVEGCEIGQRGKYVRIA